MPNVRSRKRSAPGALHKGERSHKSNGKEKLEIEGAKRVVRGELSADSVCRLNADRHACRDKRS